MSRSLFNPGGIHFSWLGVRGPRSKTPAISKNFSPSKKKKKKKTADFIVWGTWFCFFVLFCFVFRRSGKDCYGKKYTLEEGSRHNFTKLLKTSKTANFTSFYIFYLYLFIYNIRRIARLFPTVHYALNLRDAARNEFFEKDYGKKIRF